MILPLEKTLEFNFQPQNYLHTGWGKAIPHVKLMRDLYASGQCDAELSDYILQTFNLRSETCFELDSPRAELVLLTNSELNEVFIRAGLLQCARQIALLLMPKDIKQVQQLIGEHRYAWVMSQWADLHGTGAIPQGRIKFQGSNVEKTLLQVGLRGVSTYLSNLPKAFRIRLFMKMHPAIVARLSKFNGVSEEAGKVLLVSAIKDIRSAEKPEAGAA